jgi:transcriptional regulator with XRE-family HTH domain
MPRFDGALMRARRQHLNLSAPDLADLSKVPYASVLRFETGRQRPSIAALEKLCRTLACDPNSLFTADDDEEVDILPTDLGAAADRWIAETLASAPPMTERQAARLSAILFGKAS